MSFKTSSGFTLIEVMMATAIMAIMFASIFALQSSITRSVIAVTQRFERTLQAHNFFIEASDESDEVEKEVVTSTKKIARPATELQYKKSKLISESPFGKFAHDLYKQQVTIVWQDGKNKRQETLIGYVYQPKQAEKPGDDKEKGAQSKSPPSTANSTSGASSSTQEQTTSSSPKPATPPEQPTRASVTASVTTAAATVGAAQ